MRRVRLRKGTDDEADEVYRGADHRSAARAGVGVEDRRCVPQARHQRSDLLHLWTALPAQASSSSIPADLGANIYPASPGMLARPNGKSARREPQQLGGFDEPLEMSHYKSQVPHAPIVSAGSLL
jgi:hypothetical protein